MGHPILVLQNVVVSPTDVIRILHVDDDSSQGDFLNYFLPVSDDSFMIQPICDPGKVLNELRKNKYDCVVTDYQMPELNGIELAALIRKEFDIPIIIYTGQGSEEVAEAAFTVGIDDYMRKEMDPSHYQVLAKRIRSVVEKKRVDTLYKTVIEQTSDALIIVVDKKVVFANKAFLDLFGVRDASEIQDPLSITVSEDNEERTHRRLKEVVANNSRIEYKQYKLKKKNGKMIDVEVSTSPVTYNGNIGALSFVRDITEKKRLEAEKQETQERLRSLVELAPDGIMTANLKGEITSVNSAFCQITGYDVEEIIGKNFLNLKTVRSSDLKQYFRVFSSVLRGKIPPPFEFKYVSKNGKMGWGEAHIGVINFSSQKELIGIFRDITKRKINEKNVNTSEGPTLDLPKEAKDNLLISMGQLAWLIGNEIIDPMRHTKYLCDEVANDQNKFIDNLPEIQNTLDMALMTLEGFISRIDETIFKPSEKSIIDLVTDTLNQTNNQTFEINTKYSGEIIVNVDDLKLKSILNILLKKIINIVGKGSMDILVDSNGASVKIVFSSIKDESNSQITLDVVKSIKNDPEIILYREEMIDLGGDIKFDTKRTNPVILIIIPTYKKIKMTAEIPELKNLFYNVREINTRV